MSRPRRRVAVLVATLAGAAALSTVPWSAAAPADPPQIVEWNQVGGVVIGLPQSKVVAAYGQGKHGTRYNRYAIHGGHLTIQYDASGHVNGITVEDTPYYKAPDGFAVGYTIPLGTCHKHGSTCTYAWNGFSSVGGDSWDRTLVWNGARIYVYITIASGKVQSFAIAKLGDVGTALTPSASVKAAIVAATLKAWCGGSSPCNAKITKVELSKTDPTFAGDQVHQPGAEGAVALLHRTGSTWTLLDVGTDQIGCGKAPKAVLNDLELYCDG